MDKQWSEVFMSTAKVNKPRSKQMYANAFLPKTRFTKQSIASSTHNQVIITLIVLFK